MGIRLFPGILVPGEKCVSQKVSKGHTKLKKKFQADVSSKKQTKECYRVSHIEVYKVNQLWGVEGFIILLNYDA